MLPPTFITKKHNKPDNNQHKNSLIATLLYAGPATIGLLLYSAGVHPLIPTGAFDAILQSLAAITGTIIVAVFYLAKIDDGQRDFMKTAYGLESSVEALSDQSPDKMPITR